MKGDFRKNAIFTFMLLAACGGCAHTSAPPAPSIAWAHGLDPSRAYRLVDLPKKADAISLMMMMPLAQTYRVTFEPSGKVTFQKGRLGHYWLNRERVPALYPYGGMQRSPDAWQPSTVDEGVADIGAENARNLFAAKAAWVAQGSIGATCSESDLHYNIATTEHVTIPATEILLRGRDAPVRLDCDPRAAAFVNEATRLFSPLVPSANPQTTPNQ